jgi:hypothetical protein
LTPGGLARAQGNPLPDTGMDSPVTVLPFYDEGERDLWYDGRLVKHLRLDASSQQSILEAFQEAGWVRSILDPLPDLYTRTAQERLHDALRRLNEQQTASLIRFGREARGRRVYWRLRA